MAYYQLDPFGGIRGDYHAALITANIMNAQVGEVKFHKEDFLLKFGPAQTTKRMSVEQMKANLRAAFARATKHE